MDHFANLSIEAIKAIVGVCISTTILTLTTVSTWCVRKLLKKRSAQTIQTENLPMHQSFDNPSAVHVEELTQATETALPAVNCTAPDANFQGPVFLENELYHSPVNH